MKKKNDTPSEHKKCEIESEVCCYRSCNNKFKWAFFTAVLIVICAVYEHFYNEHNYMRMSEDNKIETQDAIKESQKSYLCQITDLRNEIASLKNEISSLKTNIADKKNVLDAHDQDKNIVRKRWKIWSDLRAQMEANVAFNKELEIFLDEFAYDEELIALVKDLAKGVCVTTSAIDEKNNDVIDTCKKYIKKMIRVKKIDYRKLLEISGYVLSSIENQD